MEVDKRTGRCAGPKLEAETWQPGVIENKIKKHHTYLVAANYWAPLNNDNKENESEEEEAKGFVIWH